MIHARLSPSNHRWPKCPGSVREEAVYPDDSGAAAIDGTGSHLLLELCVHLGKANKYFGQVIGQGHPDKPEGWLVDQERINRVNDALAYIQRRVTELGGASVESESTSNPGQAFGRDDWHGTCDVTLTGITHNVLEVIDYKDGRGFISVQDNPQLLAYAGGKLVPHVMQGMVIPNLTEAGIESVRMTIIQPKTNPVIRYVDMTVAEVWEKVGQLAIAAKKTDDPDAPLVAGDHCTWCKHGRAGNCPARSQIAMEGLTIMTETVGQSSMIEAIKSGEIAPGTMSESQLAAILDIGKVVTKLIDQVEAEALKRLQDGTAIPGYQIGEGRKSREWRDDEEIVAAKLKGMRFKKDEIYPPKLITPAAAEKKDGLSQRQLDNLQMMIDVVKGKDKVVPAKETKAQEVFKEINFMTGEPDFMSGTLL